MPKVLESMFTAYEFTPEEFLQGMQLTELQTKFIIHERTIRAQQQILMPMDSMDPDQFKVDWHRSMGFMEALTWILTCSEDVKTELRRTLQEVALETQAKKESPTVSREF